MPIVQDLSNMVLDNVYLIETQSPPSIQGIATGVIKMAGVFNKGIPGAVYTIDNYTNAVKYLGPSSAGIDGPISIQNLINQKNGGIKVVPVFGSTAATASVILQDASSGNVLKLTAAQAHPQSGIMTPIFGTDPNNMVATVANSATGKFDVIIKYGNITETYLQVTLANMVATINAKSAIAIASIPTTPSALIAKVGSFPFAGGITGTPIDADIVGTIDGSGNRTGLKALEPVVGNIIIATDLYSTAVNAAIATHATSFQCIGLICNPMASATIANIQTAAALTVQDNVVFCDGWRTALDADTNLVDYVPPNVLVAGMSGQLPVHKSWGNKTITGTISAVTPRPDPDLITLQQYNVLCVTDNIPRGGVGTRSGIASNGSDIYVRAMRYFLELSVIKSMGWAVDEMQSSSPTDQLRKDVKGSVDAFLSPMANPINKASKMIDSFITVCDLSNNPPDQIALGKLSCITRVRLLGAAKDIIIYSDISQNTITTNSQAA